MSHIFLSFSLKLSLSLSLSLSPLSLSLTHTLAVFLSFSLPFALSLYDYLSLSFFSRSLYDSLTLSFSLSLSLSLIISLYFSSCIFSCLDNSMTLPRHIAKSQRSNHIRQSLLYCLNIRDLQTWLFVLIFLQVGIKRTTWNIVCICSFTPHYIMD